MTGVTRWACVAAAAFLAADASGQETKSTAKSRARASTTKAAARPRPGTFIVQRIMAIADTNRDGSLTPDEAGNAASKLVKSAEPKKNAAPTSQQLAQVLNTQFRPQGMGGPGGPPPDGGPGGFGGPPGGPGGPPGGPGRDQAGGQARRNGGPGGQGGGNQAGPGGPPPGGFGGPDGGPDGPPPDGFDGPGGPAPGGFGGPPGGGPGGPGGPPGGFGGPGTMLATAAVEYGDTNGDGKLSSQEARAAAQKFIKELDKDRKGKVSAAALLEVVGRRMGPPGSLAPRASAILAYADLDKDGKLTPEEASVAATKFVRGIEGGAEGSIGSESLAKALGMPSRPMRGNGNANGNRRPGGEDNPGGPPGGGPPAGGPPDGGPAGRIMALADGDNDVRLTPEEAGAAAAKLVREAAGQDRGVDLEGLWDGLNKLAGPPRGGPGGPPGEGPDSEPR